MFFKGTFFFIKRGTSSSNFKTNGCRKKEDIKLEMINVVIVKK